MPTPTRGSIQSRSALDVLTDHLRKRKEGRLNEDIALNFAPDAVLFTATGILRGHAGVREAYQALLAALPGAVFTYKTLLVEGELAYVEWSALGDQSRVRDGADTFLIRRGRIAAQALHYTAEDLT